MTTIAKALEALNITEWSLHGEPANETEFNQQFHKIIGADAAGSAVYEPNKENWGVTWAQVSAKKDELVAAEPMRLLREERNKLLAETDWWVLPDRTPTQEQLDYRQALRDITNTYTSLDDVVWPTKPE